MICSPLKNLFDWCETEHVHVSRHDLIQATCGECHQQETCPAGLVPLEEKDLSDDEN